MLDPRLPTGAIALGAYVAISQQTGRDRVDVDERFAAGDRPAHGGDGR